MGEDAVKGTTPEFRHTLVIGGTGMLREATIELARRSRLLTAVSHSRTALRDLGQALSGAPCERRLLSLDWHDAVDFIASLKRHVEVAGAPSLAVAWLHEPALGPAVANAISLPGVRCAFFQVFGSDAADPARGPNTLREALEPRGDLDYHEVILGFRRMEGGSRWLTHAEISAGVLEAVRLREPSHTVGVVTPWSDRPKGIPVERLQT
jgi:hypothetical protein